MRAILALLLVTGCVGQVDDDDDVGGGGKADGNGTCDEPMYGDGTCQIDLACGIPDIDCYKVVDTDEAAAMEGTNLGIQTLPPTDPHYAATRARVDKAWELYKAGVQLGKLADKRLSVVIVNDPSVNAFVSPTDVPGVGLFAVFVNTGLVDAPGMTDDQFDGIFFHELTHLAKLHVSDEVAERLRRYYMVPDDQTEPLGSTQIQHQDIHDKMVEWKKLPELTGWYYDDALNNLAFGGYLWSLEVQYLDKVKTAMPACETQANAVRARPELIKLEYWNQQLLIPDGYAQGTKTAIDALRTCVASDPMTFKQFRDGLDANWVSYLATVITPEDAQYDGMRALDGLLAFAHAKLAKLKVIEATIEASTGRPFSTLRFFSQEEEADDMSARLTKINKLAEIGSSGFLKAALKEEMPKCDAAIAAGGLLPYGRILDDDHHADCWRIAHQRQVYDHVDRMAPVVVRAPEPWTPTRVRRGPIF